MGDLAVMYHYVRQRDGWSGISPLLPEDFEKQIEVISRTHEIVSVDDLNRPSNKPRCVLTFDDGTKDQYEIAYPILKKKGVPAYFTVMSGPIVTGRMPVFHLVHTVLSLKSDLEIWQLLSEKYVTDEVHEKSKIYHYEKDTYRRYNKYVLNFLLSDFDARNFLEGVLASLSIDPSDLIPTFYLNKDEIREMVGNGMTIGVHCHNHTPYTGDGRKFFNEEIDPCIRFLKEVVGIVPQWYTPSFGGGIHKDSMKKDLEPILRENGFKGGFTTEPGLNDGMSQFWLKRVDCIYLPPNKNQDLEEALKAII
ncbi:polysaccharide deacetylase family protein [Paenibacillus peoriae]|uniref:polysaccharide deacetylase family protein n=1 Tax=Paenibacillus peoriae TaxID=59893 RepID=UPI00096E45BD|nr:polysaccharide deacetylase family protein [Paenibacillus peoriae]OMF49981.1 polysaccharide deacetylase [Paenibacillus peoriae]